VSPREGDQQGNAEEGAGVRPGEQILKKVFGESLEEALRAASEEGVSARARKSWQFRTRRKWMVAI
jgi:hypothetical protein